MKKSLLFAFSLLATSSMVAQTDEPIIIDTFRCDQMSGNGEWMIGRSNTWDDGTGYLSTESSICNTRTGEIFGWADLYTLTPYSRPISSKGIGVASTYDEATNWTEVPFLLVPGQEPKILSQFYTQGQFAGKDCYAVAITDEATAFLGYYEIGNKRYPFISDINEDLTVGEPDFLPLPQKDVFGSEPYTVHLCCMSDDATRVAGTVVSVFPGIGQKSYPIVYTKDTNGEWTYSYPMDFMTDSSSPETAVSFYQYQVAISPDGTKFACTQEVPDKSGSFPEYVVWSVDLGSGKAEKIESENPDIVATRILDNGIITGTFFATIKISYIYIPGAEDFVDFVEYTKGVNPEYGEWMEDNLMVKVQDVDQNGQIVDRVLPNTGQIYVADDMTAFGSGFQTSNYDEYYNLGLWSYVFTNFEQSGLKDTFSTSETGPLPVYNIQGIRVATLDSEAQISALPAGLYIIGSRKILVK